MWYSRIQQKAVGEELPKGVADECMRTPFGFTPDEPPQIQGVHTSHVGAPWTEWRNLTVCGTQLLICFYENEESSAKLIELAASVATRLPLWTLNGSSESP